MLNGEADRRDSCSLLELSRPNIQLQFEITRLRNWDIKPNSLTRSLAAIEILDAPKHDYVPF